ncbi:MAG: V-type ATPase subunit [Candidatus Woesearchaeota archaeon]
MEQKISYEFSPYTYARVSAMKGLLLKKNDYEKLLKLELNEIIKFLQEGTYSNEINELALKYQGLKLIERALNKNLSKILTKIRQISDIEIQPLIDMYLKRYDYYNIKTLLRAKYSNLNFEEIEDLLIPVSSLNKNNLKKLYQKQIINILVDSKLLPNSIAKEEISKYENTKDLSSIENTLDFFYYKSTLQLSQKIPEEGKLFKEFFEHEISIYNLKLILKKIAFELDKREIEKYIINGSKIFSIQQIKNLINSQSYESFYNEFKKTYYGKFIDFKEKDLLKYEVLFENFLLKKRNLLSHQHPLTVDTILGFMFQKETEVKNLKVIVKSKSLQLESDYVEKLLVY